MKRTILTIAIASASGLAMPAVAQVECVNELQQSLLVRDSPEMKNATDGVSYELGTVIQPSVNGRIIGIRHWKAPSEPALESRAARIWSVSDRQVLNQTSFTRESPAGWQFAQIVFNAKAGEKYMVSVEVQSHYVGTDDGLTRGISFCQLTAPTDGISGTNGFFGAPGFFPTQTYRNTNYFRDVVFVPTESIIAFNLGDPRRSGVVREFVNLQIDDVERDLSGVPVSTSVGIDVSQVSARTPAQIYQSAVYGNPVGPGLQFLLAGLASSRGEPLLTPGAKYRVRLHFAEINYASAGERLFNVLINEQQVLSNFDIVAAAGGPNRAIALEFETRAINVQGGVGGIVIRATNGSAGVPLLNAIEVIPLN